MNDDQGVVRVGPRLTAAAALLWVAWWFAWAAEVHAQELVGSAATVASPEPEPDTRLIAGLSAFGGALLSKEERRGGGGASLSLSVVVVPERWEIEAGLSLAKPHDADPLGVFEVIGRRNFERRGPWTPHLLLGPLVSLDFGHETRGSGGLVAGGGVTHWLNARFGVCAESAYRLLIGTEVEHLLTVSLGLRARL